MNFPEQSCFWKERHRKTEKGACGSVWHWRCRLLCGRGTGKSGVGHLALVDGDVVSLTNINRQLIATQKTIGRRKTSVMAERIHEILPETEVVEYPVVYGAEKQGFAGFCFV